MQIVSKYFNVDSEGNMSCTSGTFDGNINLTEVGDSSDYRFRISRGDNYVYMNPAQMGFNYGNKRCSIDLSETPNVNIILSNTVSQSSSSTTRVSSVGIRTPELEQTSLAKQKKNFEKMKDNALKIIKQIDIYKYNLNFEKDTDKKHIGFVIGDKYNYSEEVTSNDNTGVDTYSFISLCCKAIQEQQKLIEELQDKVEKLEKGEE